MVATDVAVETINTDLGVEIVLACRIAEAEMTNELKRKSIAQ